MIEKPYINFFLCLLTFVLLGFLGLSRADAKDLTSSNFILRDPVIGVGGGYGASGTFRMFQSLDPLLTGANSSTTFLGHYGFLYFSGASITPSPTPTPGGGGGGGGGNTGVITGVTFSGRAYPLSKVSFLKDGQLVLSTIAGPDSKFTATLSGLASGDYTFSVYGEDKSGMRSSPFTFQIYITEGVTTNIGGIFIAPTIAVDKSEVKQGDNITIFGQSAQAATVVISVNSAQEFFNNTTSDKDGIYLHNFDTSVLAMGNHSTRSKAMVGNEISSFGDLAHFIVGTKNVLAEAPGKLTKCDLNEDSRCNLIDFSIAAFWYKRALSPAFAIKEKAHLNGDGVINLIDFSIMAYYWTG
ncbi:MAG: hypothetical protein V4486_03380 [Patescibacteria group bacterium]